MNKKQQELPVSDQSLYMCMPEQLEWKPWAIKGAYFKLLNADSVTGRFTILIKFDKGVNAPLHRHAGAVEGLILQGGFYYLHDPQTYFETGAYLLEMAGAVHQPVSPEGAVMLAIFHGPVEGLDDEGRVTGLIDWEWHVNKWHQK